MKKIFSILLLSLLFFLRANSQCSMCRAVAESAVDENTIATGLNAGIIYLLAIPYLLIGGIAFFFFRKPIAETFEGLKRAYLKR